MQRLVWFSIVTVFCFFGHALADTFVVYPDGSGAYPTIQSAIDQSVTGDIIELADGTFTGDGNRDLSFLGKGIVLRSQNNTPALCIINCDGQAGDPHRAVSCITGEPSGTEISGITITNGFATDMNQGSAVDISVESQLAINNCIINYCIGSAIDINWLSAVEISETIFTSNQSDFGGAINAGNCTVIISNCEFTGNIGGFYGGIVSCYGTHLSLSNSLFNLNTGSPVDLNDPSPIPNTIINCLFIENSSSFNASAIDMFCGVETEITNCTFIRNSDTGYTGTIFSDKISNTLIKNCTFWRNSTNAAVLQCGHQLVEIENTIVAGTIGGAAVHASYYMPELLCANLWGNEGGDWTAEIEDQFGVDGNISADPLFCDPEAIELTLDLASPCAPYSEPNPNCDLIGAWPVDCGVSAAGRATWGTIKNLYR